jgi:adenosine deaminase
MKLAKEIYFNINGISIFHLWNVYKNKFKKISSQTFKNMTHFCKFSKFNFTWNEYLLKDELHCKVYLRRMNETIQVDINKKEIDIIKTAQKSVRNIVSKSGIVIETNPSSNIIIGKLNNIFDHHIFNLNSQDLSEEAGIDKSIIVTINSDDPAVFNTNVNNEFAYIFFALQKKGYSRENILKWIDKVRQYGLDFSFINDREDETYDSIYNEICMIMGV